LNIRSVGERLERSMKETSISLQFDRDVSIHFRDPGFGDIQKRIQSVRERGIEIGAIFKEIEDLASRNGVRTLKKEQRSGFHGYDGSGGWITSELLTVVLNASSIAALIFTFREAIHKYLEKNKSVYIRKGDVTVYINGGVDFDKIVELLKDIDNPKELDVLDLKSEFEVYKILSGQWFDNNDLQDLTFRLHIDWDNLSGETKDSKARSLVKYCAKFGIMSQLVQVIIELRPNLKSNLN